MLIAVHRTHHLMDLPLCRMSEGNQPGCLLQECLPAIKLHKANEWKKVHACGLSSWDLACTTTGANSPEFIFGTGGVLRIAAIYSMSWHLEITCASN